MLFDPRRANAADNGSKRLTLTRDFLVTSNKTLDNVTTTNSRLYCILNSMNNSTMSTVLL